MIYNFEGKEIEINDVELDKLIDTLEISLEEAIDLWLDDNGYIKNEVAEELTQKAKINKSVKHDTASKPREVKERKKKENPFKEEIIKILQAALAAHGLNPIVTNVSKLIEFEYDGNRFKIDLIQKRKKED